MEEVNLGIENLDPIDINISNFNITENSNNNSSSVSFGPGIELLMNDKKKSNNTTTSFNIDDLDNLENDLNNLSSKPTNYKSVGNNGGNNGVFESLPDNGSETGNHSTNKTVNGLSNMFGWMNGGGNTNTENIKSDNSNVGKATVGSVSGNTQTFDGYGKINDIPNNFNDEKLNEREKRRKKRMMIKKLDEWYEKGVIKNSSHFNLDSDYTEIEDEYEACLDEKRRKDSVKLQGWWFLTFVNSLEYANTVFNPFDLNLDGWGEQVSEDLDSYEEIFNELHSKYKGGKLSPELSLLLRLGFSAAVVNITNKALSTSTPGFNDIIKQSPELMKMFTNATVQSMNQQNPTASFVNNVLNQNTSSNINNSFGPPPPPVQTKGSSSQSQPSRNMQFTQIPNNRPDISASKGVMFREKGIDITNSQNNIVNQERTPVNAKPANSNFSSVNNNYQPTQTRPEMRGPQGDINEILSGLKIKPPAQEYQTSVQNMDNLDIDETESIISATSLKELQNSGRSKRNGKRKPRSDKNIISLDL
jgi:hypothetical protein